MATKTKFALMIAIFAIAALMGFVYLAYADAALLNPSGLIGEKQKDLLYLVTGLMLIVVLPVFILTFLIGWKYRAENKKAEHKPNWDHSLLAECVWWGVPFTIIVILGIFTWRSCHDLDPFRPIPSKKEMTIQVIALQWKWLFIYPEEEIASVNYFKFPKNTSIHFELTADAPMNSFWIPKLGGQIYAMPGMRSELYLQANKTGVFRGSSAHLSGKGFSSMIFEAESTSNEDFESWVSSIKSSSSHLTEQIYNKLVQPSEFNPPSFFILDDPGVFDRAVMKYMRPMP